VSEWRERAACRGRDPTWWFGSPFEQSVALRVCASCPVRVKCLHAALVEEKGLRAADRFGVWGGMVPSERVRVSVSIREADLAVTSQSLQPENWCQSVGSREERFPQLKRHFGHLWITLKTPRTEPRL
jgi:WhiB family redox-sensing transcriptional regulator